MVVKKAGTPVSAKKKSVEEMKKLSEKKKKIMMKEESEEEEEEDTSDEGEEESEADDEEVGSDEGSEEDDDEDDEEDDDDDDDDDDDEEEEDDDESEDDHAVTSKKQQKGQTPAVSTKTPSKTPSKQPLQKNEVQSNKKTPNKKKGLFENDTSPKKFAKADDSAMKTPSSKQQKDTSIAKGTNEKRKREDDEEGLSKKSRTDAQVSASFYSEEKRQRDLRCLFVRQFPKDTTEDELKALSPDILAVRFPGRRKGRGFAFLEFASEKKAEENFSVLEKSKIKGEKLYVDYVGEKSKKFKSQLQNKQPRPDNKKRIFISGLPIAATMEDIGKHFPQAMVIFIKTSGNTRFAHVDFETEAAGEEALKQNSSLTVKGQPVTVMYGFANKSSRRKPSKRKLAKEGGQRKKMTKPNQKIQKKKKEEEEEEEDDDDDDDDDDGDEDESDDEESDEE